MNFAPTNSENLNKTDQQGKQIVVKLGGSTLKCESALSKFVAQISVLVKQGHDIVIVHGAGPQINEFLQAHGMLAKFCNGLRITDGDTFMAVYAALGQMNSMIVAALQEAGVPAVGLHAEPDLFHCEKKEKVMYKGEQVDLGWVGEIKSTNPSIFTKLPGSVAVISPIGWDHHRNRYNINADHAALGLATALKAQRLVFVSNVPGVLVDIDDPHSVIAQLNKQAIEQLIETDVVSGGMIPKLMSCLASVEAGVQSVSIVSGNDSSALVQLVENGAQVGTTIVGHETPFSISRNISNAPLKATA